MVYNFLLLRRPPCPDASLLVPDIARHQITQTPCALCDCSTLTLLCAGGLFGQFH